MSNPLPAPRVILVTVFLLLPTCSIIAQTPCSLGTSYRACPACGTARSVKAQRDNVLKNRDESATNLKALTVDYIRSPIRNNSFYPDMQVEVSGYVAKVEGGSVKVSSNCARRDLRSIHIYIVAKWEEATDQRKYIVLEISPRWQKKLGLDDSYFDNMVKTLRSQIHKKWVKFRGWMFYDSVHIDESESTNPGNMMNWRATPWEIHPVTYYEVLSRPPKVFFPNR